MRLEPGTAVGTKRRITGGFDLHACVIRTIASASSTCVVNLVLYHGVFAANAKWRRKIVPQPAPPAEP